MKNMIYKFLIFLIAILVGYVLSIDFKDYNKIDSSNQRIRSTSSPKAGIEAKKGRAEYFYRILKNPKTNEIPRDIRERELDFAKQLPRKTDLNKTSNAMALEWKEAGPYDVGGRTRALAVDITNPNTIIAGGITGGIWKSTDKGETWQMKSTTNQVLSVTSLVQDPRPGNTSTWYYTSGEWEGSGPDLGYTAFFFGGGIYKSIDNGETWNVLPNASGGSIAGYDGPFDFISKIIINPSTGTIFAASHAVGIIRSSDGGNSWSLAIGGSQDHMWLDIVVTTNGTLVASLSADGNETPANAPGIYKSADDGQTWTSITPNTYPAKHFRTVLATTAANNNIVYALTNTGDFIDEKYDDVRFYKINISNGTSEDRSSNMPNFGYDFEDWVKTQNNYNMVLAVKPDDENFVLIGATSFFRSTNGFSSKPTNAKLDWIGGYSYSNNAFFYPNFHCDIHSFAFDPTNPNAMWWGHDGGLTYTSNITNTSYEEFFPWENKNNGYNVTQFYMIAIPDEAGDDRIGGGTQDNGSPTFRFDGTNATESYDLSTGDGAYNYFGNDYPYTSVQNGLVIRGEYDAQENPRRDYPNWSNITPKDATGMLFINPYSIDPSDENIMYYPAGNSLWRNTQIGSLPNNTNYGEGLADGWAKLDNLSAPQGYVITAIEVSSANPSHTLYYGANDWSQNPSSGKLYKVSGANSVTSGAVDISFSGLNPGVYIHNIAVNPTDGNELIVILSNYGIESIYHSSNGGQSFTGIEGNLGGNDGPSVRGASILPYNGTATYFVGTSIGVFSTTSLNSSQTVWEQEGANSIGNVIVNYIASRPSDGKVVAGTHGRGAFVGGGSSASAPKPTVDVQALELNVRPGEIGSTNFTLRNEGESNLTFNISASGDFVLGKTENNNFVMKKATSNRNLNDIKGKSQNQQRNEGKFVSAAKSSKLNKQNEILGDDVYFLDDGDATADNFFGFGDGSDLYWYNEFNINGFNFQLDEIYFFMRTESAFLNYLYIGLYDENLNIISEGTLEFETSADGQWYSVALDPAIEIQDGKTFFIEIETQGSGILYPAGVDFDATIPNKSYYFNGVEWVNINTVSGFENGAFLIRAAGTAIGGSNQDPVAIAQVSKTQAETNETITFDASQSYDNDGTIAQYLWNFGDGNTSTQQSAGHSYTQANTYTYTLTVTDNQGATGQASGQITIGEPANQYVTIEPSSGTITPGNSQQITVTLDASTVNTGSYSGQITLATNGGNIAIPIGYIVNIKRVEGLPIEYSLSQNYPNPFNPSTTIEFALPKSEDVSLIVYDMLGRKVTTLVNEKLTAGNYSIYFHASDMMTSGVYFYRIRTESYTSVKKLLLLK